MSPADTDLALAFGLADAADAIALRRFATGGTAWRPKSDGSPVSAADEQIELALRTQILRERPADALLGEELGAIGSGHRRWVIDAIDGTVSFLAGEQEWSTLIALEEQGSVTPGLVTAPALRRRWWAAHEVHPPSTRDFGGTLKLLLTSGGVTNPSIRSALVQLLGKPISECHALCVPTAQWGHPMCGPSSVRGLVAAEPTWQHLSGLSWASLGVLELTALPTIGAERYVPWIREADVLLVDGGDATYLGHWMRESGLADLLPSLPDTVWVGVSAGSMVMTPRIGAYFVEWPSAPDDRTLGVVDFSIFPHLDAFPQNTLADAERWAADIGVPAYAIDEQTAIKVVDGSVEVVSEGQWTKLG